MLEMHELDLNNKRIVIREDFNVPVKDGDITDDARIIAALPTLRAALTANAKIIVISHLGRPKEGQYDESYSLAPIVNRLSQLLNHPVRLEKNWLDGIEFQDNEIILCENVRFASGEKANDSTLAKKIAALGDIFVMDAFAVAHRKHASSYGAAQFAKTACIGPLLSKEIKALNSALDNSKPPAIAIIGGAKVSTKISLIESLLDQVDIIIPGGGIANTFIAAKHPVGKSLYEENFISQVADLLTLAKQKKC